MVTVWLLFRSQFYIKKNDIMFIFLQIVEYANKKEFTSMIVVHTNRREPG